MLSRGFHGAYMVLSRSSTEIHKKRGRIQIWDPLKHFPTWSFLLVEHHESPWITVEHRGAPWSTVEHREETWKCFPRSFQNLILPWASPWCRNNCHTPSDHDAILQILLCEKPMVDFDSHSFIFFF